MALLSLGISGLFAGILAIIFGILVIKFPKIVAWLIGAYLIITGLITVVATL